MNKLLLFIALSTFVLSSPTVLAQTGGTAPQSSSSTASSNNHTMMMGDMAELQAKMMKMDDAMKKIVATPDSADRQELIEEHMVAMHVSMGSMKDMMAKMQQMQTSDHMPSANPTSTAAP